MDQPINIWSGTKGLGGALTNMTELAYRKGSIQQHYPVNMRGSSYRDAEAAYQALKRGPVDEDILSLIIESKLRPHERLRDEIAKRGGVAWLTTCSHETGSNNPALEPWHGTGKRSAMIRALIEGYRQAIQGT